MEFERYTSCQVIMHNNKPCGRDFFDPRGVRCIFHDNTDIKKKEQQFLEQFNNYIKEIESAKEDAIYDFTEFVFPAISFSSYVFSKPAIFARAIFHEAVDFSGAEFKSSVNFETTFYNKADFRNSKFQKVAYFERARFYRDSHFDLAEFNLTASFFSTEFQQNTSFLRATFSEVASFDSAIFLGEAIFNEGKFLNGAMFLGASFNLFAHFERVEFHSKSGNGGNGIVKGVIFSKVNFNAGASFSYSKYKCDTDFTQVVFHGKAHFFEVIFSDEVDFYGANFATSAAFCKAEFQGGSNFTAATFGGDANFLQARFQKQTLFSTAKFLRSGSFSEAIFSGLTFFSGTEFHGKAFFEVTSFEEVVNFSRVKLFEEIHFRGNTKSKCFQNGASLQNISLSREVVMMFEKVDLGQASFLDTNLEQIVFRDIEWYQPKSGFWWRRKRALRDEFKPLYKEDARENEKIAENYRQLVLNYERKRDYEAAEDFHIGEMEMRRKNRGFWGRVPYNLYKWLSYYGTSYGRALLWIGILLLLFSGLFLYAGFQPTEGQSSQLQGVIEYNWCPDKEHHTVSIWQWFRDYGEAFQLTLSIITFQRERFYQPIGGSGRLLLFFSVIVLTSQVALVLLAIRRRFKR